MREYLEALSYVLHFGEERTDRTGTGTRGTFGKQIIVEAEKAYFPLVTTKKIFTKAMVGELLWFLSGSTNVNDLKKFGDISIWDEWADKDGELGPIYGRQWRKWTDFSGRFIIAPDNTLVFDEGGYNYTPIDQIGSVIDEIKRKPDSRRLIVSAWNVADLGQTKLHPCHVMFQFYVRNLMRKHGDTQILDMHMYQRSADIFLGVPFNIASYALLLNMVAQCVGMKAGRLFTSYGDLHLYSNHVWQAKEQLSRKPTNPPVLWLNPAITDIDKFTMADISFHHYNPHPAIQADVAV
jgi:thymidylate synthase